VTDLTAKEIAEMAEEHRHITPSLSNYSQIMNDAWVMLRELAKCVDELEKGHNTGVVGPKVEGQDA